MQRHLQRRRRVAATLCRRSPAAIDPDQGQAGSWAGRAEVVAGRIGLSARAIAAQGDAAPAANPSCGREPPCGRFGDKAIVVMKQGGNLVAMELRTTRTYRAGAHLLVVVGLLSAFFCGLGLLIFRNSGDGTFLAFSGIGTIVLFALLRILRLEIGKTWFKYQNLGGSRTVLLNHVTGACVEVGRHSKALHGVAGFYLELRNGQRQKINLRTFPVEAAAVLFSTLDAHGVDVTASEEWAARRMMEQVRAAQARLAGRA